MKSPRLWHLPFLALTLSAFFNLSPLLTQAAASDFFLHSTTADFLDNTNPTATTAKFKDSAAVKRTTFVEIGTWSAAPIASAMRLSSLTDLHAWIGLKNSDDQGTYFDLRAELRKNGVAIASGETKTIQGVTRNPDKAKEVTVSFGALSDSQFNPGDVLSVRILTKVADSGGHSNAVGLRLYYDAVSRSSRFGATFGPATSPLQVSITSPTPGSVINESTVLVLGEVIAPSGTEVGVTVNGFVGLIANSQFTALVPVDSSVTTLTATAKDAEGFTATDSISVTVQLLTAEPAVLLRASPPGGLAPLTVGFQLSSLVGVSQIALDLEGNGTVDFQGTSLEGQTFTYSQPGIYTPTVQVTDPQGQLHSAVTLVQVSDQASLDARLQAVWQGLKDALRAGNVAQAVAFIHNDTRSAYQDQLSRFSFATLANIDRYMTAIQLVEVGFGGAQYEMLRERNGQILSFSVWFQIDQDGLWRVRRF